MFDERFARQYRYEPPPEFPLASPYTGIVHHLSGPNRRAHTQTCHRRSRSATAACSKEPSLWSLSFRAWICYPRTRTFVRLLGPCFKTGQISRLLTALEMFISAYLRQEPVRGKIATNWNSIQTALDEHPSPAIQCADTKLTQRKPWLGRECLGLPCTQNRCCQLYWGFRYRMISNSSKEHFQLRYSLLP